MIPDRATWYAQPYKVFDNLYFLGTQIHSAWALTTSDGIIVIDTLFDYAIDPEIVDGLTKLKLDPKSIKILRDVFKEYVRRGHTIMMSTHTLETAESLCDRIAIIADGRLVAFALSAEAFAEDCDRVTVVVTPRKAPMACLATVIDRTRLQVGGAMALTRAGSGWEVTPARPRGRPVAGPAPRRRHSRSAGPGSARRPRPARPRWSSGRRRR